MRFKNISSIKEIVDDYDTFLIDQWGVMHNGTVGYIKAKKCIEYLYNKNKNLIIISNSSKRKKSSSDRLPKIGFEPNFFKEVMTSGEMVWNEINKSNINNKKEKKCFHIYDATKEDGLTFRKGLKNIIYTDKISDADFILACTPYAKSKPIDYIPLLKSALEKKLTMYCANPDFETVENSKNEKIFCMGMISSLYQQIGGETVILGKPEIDIYIESTKCIKLNKSRTIAIGDSIFHDIKGANNFNIDSILIKSGIHRELFNVNNLSFEKLIQNHQIFPNYLMNELSI